MSAPGATVKPVTGILPHMTVVVDIPCPACGETEAVRKVGIGQYECGACGTSFDDSQVRP